MTEQTRPARPLRPWILGTIGLVGLWIVTFYATGLLWWNAPDDYGARIERFAPLVVGVPAESEPPPGESHAR